MVVAFYVPVESEDKHFLIIPTTQAAVTPDHIPLIFLMLVSSVETTGVSAGESYSSL